MEAGEVRLWAHQAAAGRGRAGVQVRAGVLWPGKPLTVLGLGQKLWRGHSEGPALSKCASGAVCGVGPGEEGRSLLLPSGWVGEEEWPEANSRRGGASGRGSQRAPEASLPDTLSFGPFLVAIRSSGKAAAPFHLCLFLLCFSP